MSQYDIISSDELDANTRWLLLGDTAAECAKNQQLVDRYEPLTYARVPHFDNDQLCHIAVTCNAQQAFQLYIWGARVAVTVNGVVEIVSFAAKAKRIGDAFRQAGAF
jgi:hypothetical protein